MFNVLKIYQCTSTKLMKLVLFLRTEYGCVSMGQGQEVPARRILSKMRAVGGWAMLQNLHLSLDFCHEVLDTVLHGVSPEEGETHPEFRLWITTEVHPHFPIGLLQVRQTRSIFKGLIFSKLSFFI